MLSAGKIAFARLLESRGADVFVANPDGSAVVQVPLGDVAEDYGIPGLVTGREPAARLSRSSVRR